MTNPDTETELTEKYIRKPLIVEAVQVTEENFATVKRWCMGQVCNNDETPVDPAADLDPKSQYIHVRVHNPKNSRQTKAYINDWILYTERGYKVYTTKAFQQNFDLLAAVQTAELDDDEDDNGSFLPSKEAA
jgi:hypothetical protein